MPPNTACTGRLGLCPFFEPFSKLWRFPVFYPFSPQPPVTPAVRWLVENLDRVKPERLAGNLKDFYKLREGDYRVIYQILHDEKTVIIHTIGHRREIYRKK